MSNSRLGSSYLMPGSSEVLEHQLRTTHPGMAHFANTGPFGATCGNCAMLGYHRQHRNTSGDLIKTTFTHGCAKFYALTGTHGPRVPTNAAACRHFELRPERK
jgi:hypothetical protein